MHEIFLGLNSKTTSTAAQERKPHLH